MFELKENQALSQHEKNYCHNRMNKILNNVFSEDVNYNVICNDEMLASKIGFDWNIQTSPYGTCLQADCKNVLLFCFLTKDDNITIKFKKEVRVPEQMGGQTCCFIEVNVPYYKFEDFSNEMSYCTSEFWRYKSY